MRFTHKNLLSFVVGPNFEIPPITELSKLMSVTHILKARMSVNQLFATPDEEIHQWYLNFTFIWSIECQNNNLFYTLTFGSFPHEFLFLDLN